MASLTDARLSVPETAVAQARVFEGVDQTAANAVSAFGQLGGEIHAGVQSGLLKNRLEDTGQIINSLNTGEAAVRSDIAQGYIDPTTDKFQRLAAASAQGKISEQRAMIEAEVELRRSINRAPGFADQFRKLARDTLGFDPSGSALNTLFLSGPSGTKLTQKDKDLQEAQAWVDAGFATTTDEAYKGIIGARVATAKKSAQTLRVAEGSLAAGEIAVAAASDLSVRANQLMAGAFQQIDEAGGIGDVTSILTSLQQMRGQVTREWESTMASSNYEYDVAAFDAVRNRIDREVEGYQQIVQDGDLMATLARKKTVLRDVIEMEGISLAPDLALVNSVAGQAGVEFYLDAMKLAKGDPRTFAELAGVHPQLKIIANSLDATKIAPYISSMASGGVDQAIRSGLFSQEQADAMGALVGSMAAGANVTTEDGKKFWNDTILANAQSGNYPKRTLSIAAQNPAYHGIADPDSRAAVVDSFNVDQEQTIASLQKGLEGTQWVLDHDGREFRLINRNDIGIDEAQFVGPAGLARRRQRAIEQFSTGLQAQVDVLNGDMSRITQNRNWTKELGYENKEEWVRSVTDRTNLATVTATFFGNELSDLHQQMSFKQQGDFSRAVRENNIDDAIAVLEEAQIGNFGKELQIEGQFDRLEPGAMVIDRETGAITVVPGAAVGTIDRGPQQLTGEALPPVIGIGDKDPVAVGIAVDEANRVGVNKDLFSAMIMQESSFDLGAKGQGSSARGLGQITKAAAADIGIDHSELGKDAAFDLKASADYLALLRERFPNDEVAIAAYHDGPGNIKSNDPNDLSPRAKEYLRAVYKRLGTVPSFDR